jgi:hypothetical protein
MTIQIYTEFIRVLSNIHEKVSCSLIALGPVVRRPDSAIHRIVIFSSFVKSDVDWYSSY